jgi:hypothetical protein
VGQCAVLVRFFESSIPTGSLYQEDALNCHLGEFTEQIGSILPHDLFGNLGSSSLSAPRDPHLIE